MNPTIRNILVLLFLLAYGKFVVTFNGAAANASHKAETIVANLEAGKPVPAEVGALKESAGQYKKTVYLVNMALMFLAFYVGLGPMVGAALDKGADEVSAGLRAAERRQETAKQDLAEAEARMAKIDGDVEALRQRERDAATADASRLAEFGAKEAAQIAGHADLSVQREEKDAREALIARVAEKAVAKAVEGFHGDLDEATRSRLQRTMVEGLQA